MPTTHSRPYALHRDSWPPVQLRLLQSIEEEDIDAHHHHHHQHQHHQQEAAQSAPVDHKQAHLLSPPQDSGDPLTYFLSPTPLLQPDEADDDFLDTDMLDMDFTAGIEDSSRPVPIVRSVSPSSLSGLARRPPTPPRRSSSLTSMTSSASPSSSAASSPRRCPCPSDTESTTDEDDDDHDAAEEEDDYVLFGGVGRLHARPFHLRDFAGLKARRAARARHAASLSVPSLSSSSRRPRLPPALLPATSASASLSIPASPPSRGRSQGRLGPGAGMATGAAGVSQLSRLSPSGRRSPHAWRQPSPEVYDIAEEEEGEEEEEKGDVGMDYGRSKGQKTFGGEGGGSVLAAATKPKKGGKRVRFVLPPQHII